MNNSIWQDIFSSSSPEERAILVVEHFINTLPKEIALVVRRCVILHWFDEDIVKALLQDFPLSQEDARGICQRIQSFPFIETLLWGLAFNHSTREGLLRRYSVNDAELLRTAARYAAPAYKAHQQDSLFAGEAFFCYVVAGDITSALEVFKELLKKALDKGSWEYVKGLEMILEEAQKLPFVIQSPLLPRNKREYESFIQQVLRESAGDNETEIPINNVAGTATKISTSRTSVSNTNKASRSKIKSDQKDRQHLHAPVNRASEVAVKPNEKLLTGSSESQKAPKKEEPTNGAEPPHFTLKDDTRAANRGGQQIGKRPQRITRSQWVSIAVVLIILGTLLWVLGIIFSVLSLLASIMSALFGGVGVLIMFLTWASPLPTPQENGGGRTNRTLGVLSHPLWGSNRVRVGTILLGLLLIAGLLFYVFHPHNDHPTSSHLSSIPYPPNKGILVLNDTLNEKTSNSNWDEDSNCSFSGNAYHISANDGFYPCFDENTNFSDFAFQVEMVFLTSDNSSNGAGIIFRADKADSLYYGFFISEVGNGELFISTSSGMENRLILKKDIIPSFEYGNNQINLIAVVAQGEDIQVYVNKQLFADVVDDHYSQGSIGVFAQNDQSSFTSTEVEFTNAKMWTL